MHWSSSNRLQQIRIQVVQEKWTSHQLPRSSDGSSGGNGMDPEHDVPPADSHTQGVRM